MSIYLISGSKAPDFDAYIEAGHNKKREGMLLPSLFLHLIIYFAFGANFFLSTYHRAPAIHTEE